MLSDQEIEALAQGCATCSKSFQTRHFVYVAYHSSDLRSFEHQVELGIIGSDVRSMWIHVNCDEPSLVSWNMHPDIHRCIKCKHQIAKKDMVQPVFHVINPMATNPNDPTDKGLELGDRIYFIHADCRNTGLGAGSNIITL